MAGGALSTRAHRLKLSPDAEAARAEAIDLHGVCLYNNRQIGRRIKEGMHTNLLNCINMELWFGGRAPAELRAWSLHAYGSEYLRTPSLCPVVRRKTDHLAWARMGTDGCRGCMVITYEA